VYENEYANEKFINEGKTFNDIYQTFMAASGRASSKVSVASIAVAGPVADNRVEFTNIGWVIDGAKLEVQAHSQMH
jgi:glucokinase